MEVKYYDWLNHHDDIRGEKIAIRDLDTKQDISYRHLNRRAASLAVQRKRWWHRTTPVETFWRMAHEVA